MKQSHAALIRGCIKQDPRAQRELYELFAPRMLAVCYRYARSETEAEDILQEGFVKVFQSIKKCRDRAAIEGWIRRIMINTAIDIIRKEKHHFQQQEIQDRYTEDVRADALDQMEAEYLMSLIRTLPDGYRLVFNLYAVEGYSHAEIGQQLQISESTSRSQYTRARAMLKGMIQQAYRVPNSYQDVRK